MNPLALWRRAMRDDGRLRLHDAARLQGVAPGESVSEVAIRSGALAVRRCVFCAEQSRCDALLAAGDTASLRAICPNTPYLDSLAK